MPSAGPGAAPAAFALGETMRYNCQAGLPRNNASHPSPSPAIIDGRQQRGSARRQPRNASAPTTAPRRPTRWSSRCSASLSRAPLTSCSGVTYSSLMLGAGFASSRNTAWRGRGRAGQAGRCGAGRCRAGWGGAHGRPLLAGAYISMLPSFKESPRLAAALPSPGAAAGCPGRPWDLLVQGLAPSARCSLCRSALPQVL